MIYFECYSFTFLSAAEDLFDDFVRIRALSTIVEDQGEGHDQEGDTQDPDYVSLDKIQTILDNTPFLMNSPPEMHPHPLGPHPLPSTLHPFLQPEEFVEPGASSIAEGHPIIVENHSEEDLPPAPPRTSSLRNNSFTSNASIEAAMASVRQGEADAGGKGINEHKERSEKDREVVVRPQARPRRSKVNIIPPVAAPRLSVEEKQVSDGARAREISLSLAHATHDSGEVNASEESVSGKEVGVTLMETCHGGETTALVLSPPSEEVESIISSNNSIPDSNPISISGSNPVLEDNSAPCEGRSQNSPSNLSLPSSPSSSPHHHHHDTHSNTSPSTHPLETSLDMGLRQSPRLGRPSDTNGSNIRRTHSNVGGSPILRSKNAHSPVRRPSSEFVVLEPLSPEHGLELNQQYEFLRRTLSHSQRRFSQRGRKPRERKERGNARGEESNEHAAQVGLGESGLVSSQVPPGRIVEGENLPKETRQKLAIGQLKSITRESENEPVHRDTGNENLEEHVDQHGRTYYMNHVTRTIAFGTSDPDVPPQQQDMQTRREMLDRRWVLVGNRVSYCNISTLATRNQEAFDLHLIFCCFVLFRSRVSCSTSQRQ